MLAEKFIEDCKKPGGNDEEISIKIHQFIADIIALENLEEFEEEYRACYEMALIEISAALRNFSTFSTIYLTFKANTGADISETVKMMERCLYNQAQQLDEILKHCKGGNTHD